MDAGQHPPDRYGVDRFDIHLGQLQVVLVDPHPSMKLREKLGFLHVRLKLRTRLAVDHPSLATSDQFCSHQLEVVSVGDFAHEFAAIFAFLLFFLFPLSALFLRFVRALVNDFLDLYFFLGRVFPVERPVIFLDQPLHLLAIDLQNLVGLHFRRLGLPPAVELVLDFAVDVGVIALPLLVLDIFVGHYAEQLLHLLLGELAVSIWRQIGQGRRFCSARRCMAVRKVGSA